MSDEIINFPHRATYGMKKELEIRPFTAKKVRAISDKSGRSANLIYNFCIRHSLQIGAYHKFPYKYRLRGERQTVGVRLPKSWVRDLKDLSWAQQSSLSAIFDHMVSYSLAAKSIEGWAQFFSEGEDLVFDLWMYLYNETECQKNQNLYSTLTNWKPSSSSKLQTINLFMLNSRKSF